MHYIHTVTYTSHNAFSNIWLEIKLENTDFILTTSVQAHLLQHQSLCPLSLALRFQKSYISLKLCHNFSTSPENNSLIYRNLFSHLWYLFWSSWEVCQHAGCAIVSFCAGKRGVAGEIWLWSHLIWKLTNRVWLAKLWVQNWMAKMFPSCDALYILQSSLLCFTQLFSDFSEKLMKWKVTQQTWLPLNDFL